MEVGKKKARELERKEKEKAREMKKLGNKRKVEVNPEGLSKKR